MDEDLHEVEIKRLERIIGTLKLEKEEEIRKSDDLSAQINLLSKQ